MSLKNMIRTASPLSLLPLVFLFILAAGTLLIYSAGYGGLSLIGFYFVLSQVFLGTFVLLDRPKAKINLSFAIFSYCLAFWNYFAILIFHLPVTQPFYWIDWVIFIPAVLMIYSLFYFSMVFPADKKYFNKIVHWVTLIPPLGLIALLVADHNLIISGVELAGATRAPVFGQGYPVFVLYVIGYLGAVIFNLRQSYKEANTGEKTKLVYFILGATISILGFLTTNLILPWSITASLEWMGSLFSLIFLAFTAYAIVKTRLMDISVVISRTLAEAMTIVFLGGIYLGVAWLQVAYLSPSLGPLFLAFSLLYGIAVGHLYLKIRLFIQTSADKLFLHGKYNYYKELSDASRRVGEKLSLPHLLRVLYSTFHEVIEVSNPRVFLPDNFNNSEKESTAYIAYDRDTFMPLLEGETVRFDDPLVKQLLVTRSPAIDFTDPERELIVPCFLEDRLIAIFVLGKKLSEDPYTEEDIRLLQVLASQVAITLDHARSYEQIRAIFDANQKKLYDTERLLARSERIASLANLIREYNHEIKTPLSIIRGEAALLTKEARDAEYLGWFKNLVFEQVDRANDIVESTLRLSSPKERKETAVDLNDVINGALALFPISGLHLEKELPALPAIKGDAEDLQMVFVNLLKNAAEAMAGGGALKVKTYCLQEEGKAVVCAAVADSGVGIPEENLDKIFEPFFSTHVTKGRGLGLSIVFRIVREHLGRIEVKSRAGEGTTVTLRFPAA